MVGKYNENFNENKQKQSENTSNSDFDKQIFSQYDGVVVTADSIPEFTACYYCDEDSIDTVCKLPIYQKAFKTFYNENKDKYIGTPSPETLDDLKKKYHFNDGNMKPINNNQLKIIIIVSSIIFYCLYLFLIILLQKPFQKITSRFLIYFFVGTIVIIGVFIGIYFGIYNSSSPPINNSSTTKSSDGQSLLGPDLLREDANNYAYKTWCENTGNTFQEITNSKGKKIRRCLYSEGNCVNASNPDFDPNLNSSNGNSTPISKKTQKPYLVWSDNNCISPLYSTFIKKGVCDKNNFPFISGNYQCDTIEVPNKSSIMTYCKLTTQDTCEILKIYCQSKGMDFDSDDYGNCYINDIQNILEAIFGKTIVRKYKQNLENMVNSCKNKFWSANCAESIAQFSLTADQIILATTDKFLQDGIKAIQDKCTQTPYTDKNTYDCFMAMQQLNPVVFASKLAIQMIDGLLDMSIGKLFGLPPHLIQRALNAIKKFGATALAAVIKFGEKAVHAIENGYEMTIKVLDNLGGPFAIMGEGLEIIGDAVKAMAEIGKDAIIAFAHIGEEIIHAVAIVGADAAKLLSAAIGCFLHPKEFAKNMKQLFDAAKGLINDISKFLQDVITTTFDTIKDFVKDAINIVKTFFVTLANKLSQEIWNDIKNIEVKIGDAVVSAEHFVIKTVDEIGDDIKKTGQAIEKGIKKAFHWLKI
jgi:gas vesicle protein